MGRVVRAADGQPIAGAHVVLVGTLYGDATDVRGRFSLGPVRPGRYRLFVRMDGFEAVERTVDVPGHLDDSLLVRLSVARVALTDGALPPAEELSGTVVDVPSRADPYLPDRAATVTRIGGVGVRRFGSARSTPVVRGLVGGRALTVSSRVPGVSLALPGVGVLDFASTWSTGDNVVILDSVMPVSERSEFVAVNVDRRKTGDRDLVSNTGVVEAGYQGNLGAFGTRFRLEGGQAAMSAFAQGGIQSGRDFSAGDSGTFDGAFRESGMLVGGEGRLSSDVNFEAAVGVGRLGPADVPGSGLKMSSARYTGISASLSSIPEGRLIRRTQARIGWARSGAEMEGLAGAVDGEGGWRSMSAEERVARLTVTSDLQFSFLERLQAGVDLWTEEYDWVGFRVSPPGDGASPETRVSHRRDRITPYLTASIVRGQARFTVSSRFDVFRTPSGLQSDADGAAWEAGPALAITMTVRPAFRWNVGLSASTLYRPPPAFTRIPKSTPTVVRLPAASATGRSDLGGERLYFAGLRLRRTSDDLSATVGAFVILIDDYVSPVRGVDGQYDYDNTRASISGFELSFSRRLRSFVTASGYLAYTRGQNGAIGEPLPLIYPLNGRFALTASAVGEALLLEIAAEFAARQSRVATSLQERTSEGYVALHFWLSVPLARAMVLRTGIYNVLDTDFAPHGNVYVEESARRLAAPGRSWLISARLRF